MTDLFNKLKNIASDSTVRTVAGTLAAGGLLLNAVFGFGQTALGVAFQGLTAGAILGMTAVNAAKRQQQSQSNEDQEMPQYYQPDNSYDFQEEPSIRKPSVPVQLLISSFFPVTPSCGTTSKMRKEKVEEEKSTLVQKSITYFFDKVKETATSCGIASTPAKKKRRNANDDMMDMAYGTGTRDGWTPWAAKTRY